MDVDLEDYLSTAKVAPSNENGVINEFYPPKIKNYYNFTESSFSAKEPATRQILFDKGDSNIIFVTIKAYQTLNQPKDD